MAPFLSRLLIQRLITSNPSPRYVGAVSEAFRTGTFGGRTYSGRYGCLAATFAAILLDSEARFPVLDAGLSFGKMREPLLVPYFTTTSHHLTPSHLTPPHTTTHH